MLLWHRLLVCVLMYCMEKFQFKLVISVSGWYVGILVVGYI